MSHVITSQPSSESPYKPTEISNATEVPTSLNTGNLENDSGCCCVPDEKDGCCLRVFCNTIGRCFLQIGECTESFCDCLANCLIDCCDDNGRPTNQSYNYDEGDYDDNYIDEDFSNDQNDGGGFDFGGGCDSGGDTGDCDTGGGDD